MRPFLLRIGALCALVIGPVAAVRAQDGATLYAAHCASCHEATDEARAPTRDVLRQLSPEQILQALEKGVMRTQGEERSRVERRALAEFVTGKPFGGAPVNPIPKSAFCGTPGQPLGEAAGPVWNGWGATPANTRFQPAAAAGLGANDVPRLKLRWAFGFPGASSASAQPVVFGGRLYVGSWDGDVYALDAASGCIHWAIETEAGVRSAITIARTPGGSFAAYFGDLAANAYAVDAATGKLLWKSELDKYPHARITGSPALHGDRLYVPVSSREESQVADARYPCCRFRGSVVALDAATGRTIWKTYTIDREPRPRAKSRAGVQLWGPSGVAVWTAPTIDAGRNVLYVGTGNDYAPPATNMSDAIVALDLKSGAIRWVQQITENDIWNLACRATDRDPELCPDADAPDFDFAASPILVTVKGRDLLIAGNKSAVVFALDPDTGKIVWQQRVGKGGTQGGILWGPAVDGENVYIAISDFTRVSGRTPDPALGGGIAAVALDGGRVVWSAPPQPCAADRRPCSPAQAAAVTAIPGVVFSGSVDGHLRAYDTRDGAILWDFDTVRDFTTVNGVPARGGSINNGGPAVAGGMVFTNSGYSHHSGVIPGNVLLAFAVDAAGASNSER
jgi:polyvinyl alcohol dehydrogenase (cytochrome)